MKKLVFSFCSIFFVMIFIWTIMGFIKYGSDISTKHLDFKSTISGVIEVFDFKLEELTKSLESFTEISKFEGDPIEKLGVWLETLIIKPINLGLSILDLIVSFILAIFQFVFNPKFV